MSERILITGGAGYLGSVMVGHLLDAGYRVTVLDNLMYDQTSLFHFCSRPALDFVKGDVRDEPLMAHLIKEHDVLIPLAAIVGAGACDRDPQLARSVNFDAIRTLNRLRSDHQLVVFPVTNSGYGTQSGEVHCTEDTPLQPITLYGQTKVQAEAELLGSANTITLRLATVFGMSPRMRLDLLVNHFTYVAVTDGYIVIFEKDFKRNFVHIRDVAGGFVHALQNREQMVGRPFNLGLDAANMSKGELAQKIKEQVPDFTIYFSQVGTDPDKRNYIVSNQRLAHAGFAAQYSLEQGIAELIKGYRMFGRHQFMNA